MIFLGWHTFQSYKTYSVVKAEYDRITERIEALQKQNQVMGDELASIESDEGKERLIRERFDVKKEGEEVIIFIKEDTPPEEPASVFHSFTSFLKNIFGW